MRIQALLLAASLPLLPQVNTVFSDDYKKSACIAALDAKTFSLLETHPHLAVARNWIDNNAQVDTQRHTVKSDGGGALGPAREIQCQPLADGLRQIFPGSTRTRITTPCVVRFTNGPAKARKMIATVERDGSGVLAELYLEDKPAISLAIGTMLPTALPARMPDLSDIKFSKVQTRLFKADQSSAATGGFTGGYTLYLNFESAVPAKELHPKVKAYATSLEGVYDTSTSDSEFSWFMRTPAHTGLGLVLSKETSPGTWLHEFLVRTGASDTMEHGSTSGTTKPAPRPAARRPRLGLDEPQCI